MNREQKNIAQERKGFTKLTHQEHKIKQYASGESP